MVTLLAIRRHHDHSSLLALPRRESRRARSGKLHLEAEKMHIAAQPVLERRKVTGQIAVLAGVTGVVFLICRTADFLGSDCTEHCSSNKSGYDWVQQNGGTDERECNYSSQSFNEG